MKLRLPEFERIFRINPDWKKSFNKIKNYSKGTRENPYKAISDNHDSVPIVNINNK